MTPPLHRRYVGRRSSSRSRPRCSAVTYRYVPLRTVTYCRQVLLFSQSTQMLDILEDFAIRRIYNFRRCRHTTVTPPLHHYRTSIAPPSHHRHTTITPPSHHRHTTVAPPSHHRHTTATLRHLRSSAVKTES